MQYNLAVPFTILLQSFVSCQSFLPFMLKHHYRNNKQDPNIAPSISSGRFLAATSTLHNELLAETSLIDQHERYTCSNRTLYPPSKISRNGTLQVDSLHTIYYEEYGNRNDNNTNNSSTGSIALSLHGGPGAGSFPRHAQFFDPDKYQQVILFDQRGCGKSIPRGETANNTLQDLVNDIESLRIHLGVDKFDVVMGGSWGSTLALAYAQSFPERVGSMVLRGVCLFRPQEINWLFGHVDNEVPLDNKTNCVSNRDKLGEAWVNFTKGVADDGSEFEGGIRSVLKKYYNHLLGPDPIARAIATQSWFRWEMGVSSFNNSLNVGKGTDMGDVIVWDKARNSWLDRHGEVDNEIVESLRRWPQRAPHLHSISSTAKPKQVFQNNLNYNAGNLSKADAETFVPAQAMLTCHYSVNDAFMMSDFQLLKQRNIDRIRHIPCIAVQGARDFICPPDSALDLKEAWPEMECRIVTEGKHSMYDPRILSELVDATDHMAAIDIN
eukprot:scaffold10556_cov258-Chaetoceros_neogracile.AAC.17